jgi:hypothetical protein
MNCDLPERVTIRIDNHFTKHLFEKSLRTAYDMKKPIKLIFDLRLAQFDHIKDIQKIFPILERYRLQTRKYLVDTTIIVNSYFIERLIRVALFCLKAERPVNILVTP